MDKTIFFPTKQGHRETSRDAELDLIAVDPLALLGQAEPGGQPVLEQQLVELRSVSSRVCSGKCQSNLHLAERSSTARMLHASVFSVSLLITIHIAHFPVLLSCKN